MAWQTKTIIGGLALCFVLFGAAVLRTSGMYQHYRVDLEYNSRYCEAEGKAEERKNTKECQSVLYRTFDDPVALLTSALTIATIALFIVTFGLYLTAARQGVDARAAVDAARSSAEAARISAEAARQSVELERPWMTAPMVEFVSFRSVNNRLEADCVVYTKNIGKYPTKGMAVEIHIVRWEGWSEKIKEIFKNEHEKFAPKTEFYFSAIPGGIFPAPRKIIFEPGVFEPKENPHLIGVITYRKDDDDIGQTGFVAELYVNEGCELIAPHVLGYKPT